MGTRLLEDFSICLKVDVWSFVPCCFVSYFELPCLHGKLTSVNSTSPLTPPPPPPPESGGGGGASALMLRLVPHPPLRYVKQHPCHGLLRWALLHVYPALPLLVTEGHEGNDHIHYALSTSGCVSNRHWSDLKLHSPCSDG